jgi:hypothetical protein
VKYKPCVKFVTVIDKSCAIVLELASAIATTLNVDVIGDFLITFMILSFAVRLYQSGWYVFVVVIPIQVSFFPRSEI